MAEPSDTDRACCCTSHLSLYSGTCAEGAFPFLDRCVYVAADIRARRRKRRKMGVSWSEKGVLALVELRQGPRSYSGITAEATAAKSGAHGKVYILELHSYIT